MTLRQTMGRQGITLAVIVALALWVIALIVPAVAAPVSDFGICLPSPNLWLISPEWGTAVNFVILGGATTLLWWLNKEYSFVPGSDTVLTGMFLLLASTNRWITGPLTASTVMVLANLICLAILFGCYRKPNASQELFVIATIMGIGSMFQYAFIFMIPVYIVGAIMMKCLGAKSLTGFLMGLVAPYWVAAGLGLIPLENFRLPHISPFVMGRDNDFSIFAGLVAVGLCGVLTILLALNNMVKLYAGNTRRRLNNNILNLLGLVTIACIITDYHNMTAYLATLYMIFAVQIANLFALHDIRRGWIWLLSLSAVYVAGFVVMTFNV
ncbi:MAG: hypothetical protein K2M87_07605 [Muribaculaceae bacterium]|nr:hypothetical protein [Muribaculaceae bacterium]